MGYADVSCPSGYVKISESDSIIVTNSSSCPSGHTKLSDVSGSTSVTNCTTGLSSGFCTYYSESCQSGKYFDGTTHKTCIAGSYCDGSGTATPGASGCSKACPENSTSTSGATKCTCNAGYYLNGNECIICPIGSYCANNTKTACDTGYTTDNTGASTESQCYTTCEQQCTQQTCPDNATCTHGTTVTTGKQYVGGTCDASASQCELTVNCATGYELTNGTCSAIVCESGYYLDGNECIICPIGSYCANNIKTACDTGYTTDNTGAGTESQCYTTCEQQCTQQECPDNATCTHGATVTTGKQYVGGTCDAEQTTCELNITCDTGYELKDGACSAIVCASGYYLDGNECIICPLGSYCANNIKTACDTGYTTDNTGASTEFQCYTTCEVACTQQTCPDNATCTHGTTTTTGKRYVGGTCDAEQTMCEVNFECNENFELVDGVCKLVPEFTITTINMPAETRFEIQLSAAGSYVIDCGNDDVKILDKTNTDSEFIVCEYPDGGVHDIKISGKATKYNNTVAAISFEENPYIKKLGGSLGAIFSGSAPHMFNSVFYKNTSLEFVPSSLFAGISGSAPNMFRSAFNGCSSLKSVPAGLFAGVSGGAEYMFYLVFSGCTELTNVPENLFAGVSVGGPRMFHGAFNNCSSLVSIPGNIFSGLNNTGASYMFSYTFQNCASLLSIPEGLFAGISNAASNMFIGTFMGCTSLTKLPNGLFMNISGSPAQDMFDDTFSGCKKLSGYIPSDMFKNLSSSAFAPGTMTNIFANTSLYTSCPANMYQFTTGFESAWSGHVACASCPEDYPNSDAGATGVSQCYTTCEKKCAQQTCPDNATCVSQDTVTGREYHNSGYCTGASYACPIDITCNNGYIEKEPLIPVNISENASGTAWVDSEAGGGAGNKNFEDADYVGTERWAARLSYGDVYGNISCGKYCECQITRLVSAEGTVVDVQSSAPWFEFYGVGEDGSAQYECFKRCASGCASAFSDYSEYRQKMLGVYPNYCIAGRKLHIGDEIQMNLTTVKPQTARVMVFDVLGELYYGGLSETAKPINNNTDKQFRIYDPESNQNYWMHDYTVQ